VPPVREPCTNLGSPKYIKESGGNKSIRTTCLACVCACLHSTHPVLVPLMCMYGMQTMVIALWHFTVECSHFKKPMQDIWH